MPSVTSIFFVEPLRVTVSVTLSPGLCALTCAVRSSAVVIGVAVDRGDHVAGLEAGLRRGRAA